MTSEPEKAFVWTWLPGAAEPVVAGRLDREGGIVTFTYGRSYLAREDGIALYFDVLLVERFDRPASGGRRAMVSALTMLELDELMARYASYADLASPTRCQPCASSSPASSSASSAATPTTTRAITLPSGMVG